MNVLLVSARFPTTYWGFQYSLPFIGKRTSLPPLGLITLAAALPRRWALRLVDLNLRPLRDGDLAWADAVLVSGMLVQAESMREVISRARSHGLRTAVGGPAATTSPELFTGADVIFRGEAEGRIDELAHALSVAGRRPVVLSPPPGRFPSLTETPVPRFDLLEVSRYASLSIQFSRGCPHQCEFCDVVEVFGRTPRVKRPQQVLAELEALRDTGYRGSVFLVDDNFIGNRRSVRRLLPELTAWQEANGRPFSLFTEASVDLANDRQLVRTMVGAGFSAVFVGLETPSKEALAGARKRQNLNLDLRAAVHALTSAGLEVMGGFIVGFDTDDPAIFAAQREFIDGLPIPLAMVGVLSALPGTALWRRLEVEGRLRGRPSGDQFERPNFVPVMDEGVLLRGYAGLLRSLYSPAGYYRRCAALLEMAGPNPRNGATPVRNILALVRALARIGIGGRRRRHFWRLLAAGARRGPASLRRAVELAIKGEHMIRYTWDHVLPRIDRAAAEAVRPAGRCGATLPHRLERSA